MINEYALLKSISGENRSLSVKREVGVLYFVSGTSLWPVFLRRSSLLRKILFKENRCTVPVVQLNAVSARYEEMIEISEPLIRTKKKSNR